MHTHNSYKPSPLEIKQLAEFDASLGEAPEAELRRKRIVYLRDALGQLQVTESVIKGLGCFFVPFAIIPIFWPFLFFVWHMKKKAMALMGFQLQNALEYWGITREELGSA